MVVNIRARNERQKTHNCDSAGEGDLRDDEILRETGMKKTHADTLLDVCAPVFDVCGAVLDGCDPVLEDEPVKLCDNPLAELAIN